MRSSTKPLNERNNNPLNIRDNGINWNGADGASGGFVSFESPEFGFRAASRILRTYRDRHGIDTLSGILFRWAPPEDDNHTQNYIQFVSEKTGIAPGETVTENDYPVLMLAMSIFEGSRSFTLEQARNGALMA